MEKGQGPPPDLRPPAPAPAPAQPQPQPPPYSGPPVNYNTGPPANYNTGPSANFNAGVYQNQPAVQHIHQPIQYSSQQPQAVNQVVVMQQLPTDVPGQMVCPHCRNTVVTKVNYIPGMCTWLICGILALFLCWFCCFIPFCVDSCKDVEHSCPSCNNVLHIHRRR